MLCLVTAWRLAGISMKGMIPCTPENLLADQNPGDERKGVEAIRRVHAAINQYRRLSGRLPSREQYELLYQRKCTDVLLTQVLKPEDLQLDDYRFAEHLRTGDLELTPPVVYVAWRDKKGKSNFTISTSIYERSHAAKCADGYNKYHYSGYYLSTDESGEVKKYKVKDMWTDTVNVNLLPIGPKPKWMQTMEEYWNQKSSHAGNLRTFDP